MSGEAIALLIEALGPPAIKLVDGLIVKIETKGNVSAAEWAALRASGDQTAKDRMTAMLNQAGVALDSPQGLSMLAATA
jgi:hypothetical protein